MELPVITTGDVFGLNHYYYGEAYFGSLCGMRYRLAREPLKRVHTDEVDPDARFLATVWPEPWAYAISPPEARTSREFPFTAEGLAEAVAWLNACYASDIPRWTAAAETDLTTV